MQFRLTTTGETIEIDKDMLQYITVLDGTFSIDDILPELIWRKRKEYDLNDTSVEIHDNMSVKQKFVAHLRESKELLIPEDKVYHAYFDNYGVLLISGKNYYYRYDKYVLSVKNKNIYLTNKKTSERRVIYLAGEVFKYRNWLTGSTGKSGSKKAPSKTFIYEGKRVIIRERHIIAGMFIGQEAIEKVVGGGKLQVNHRNLDIFDNRPENLEIVTPKENAEHRELFNELLRLKGIRYTF